MDVEKRIQACRDRLAYTGDIFAGRKDESIRLLAAKFGGMLERHESQPGGVSSDELARLEDLFDFSERKLDTALTAMDKVRIVRHPQRICLKDILENVYDNYTEIGGRGEYNIDPSMLIARAVFSRRVGEKVISQMVMVIGQEKGHGEAFRNGGSVKPWGNAKALHYMKVAETENIPVHTFVFTPGAYPVEDWPGAAQQIARNLYELAALRVPVISVFSEGGSGGAEAVGLADRRIMLSHGYYSVISPEGAAAIEGGLKSGVRATPELIEKCARQLCITAEDNLRNGYVDRVLQEPPLGARPYHYDFFRDLRRELIQATNETVSGVKPMKLYRAMVVRASKSDDAESIFMRWTLSQSARKRLVEMRQRKFRAMSRHARKDGTGLFSRAVTSAKGSIWAPHSFLRYDLLGRQKKRLDAMFEELGAPIVDFDIISRDVVEPDKQAWKEIVAFFGEQVLQEDRTLDRQKLSDIVFNDMVKRKKLESFIHPQIAVEFSRQVQEIAAEKPGAIIQVVVPLMIEVNLQYMMDKLVVVYVPQETQIKRLAKRDNITEAAAANILASQLSIEEKVSYADYVISNEGTLEETRKHVEALWATLQQFQKDRKK